MPSRSMSLSALAALLYPHMVWEWKSPITESWGMFARNRSIRLWARGLLTTPLCRRPAVW